MAKTEVVTIWSSQVLTGAGGPTTTSAFPLPHRGAALSLRIVNGATGPTVEASIQPQVSINGSTGWTALGSAHGGGTANNADTPTVVLVDERYTWFRLVATHGSDQNVTVHAHYAETLW